MRKHRGLREFGLVRGGGGGAKRKGSSGGVRVEVVILPVI